MATKMMNKVVSSSSCVQATAMGAIAGRATRACDMCGIQRARWYCAADEAYLCARCDTSVHGANTLALRHDRICLAPTHLHGFTPSAGGSLQQKAAFKLRSTTTTSRSSTIPSKTASKNGDGVSEPDESPAAAAAAYTARAVPPTSSDCEVPVLDPSPRARDQTVTIPSRKRSRTTRPHPHHLRRLCSTAGGGGGVRGAAAAGGAGPRPCKIQKLSSNCAVDESSMVQVKIESLRDFMDGDAMDLNDDPHKSYSSSFHGGAHEVPAFITVAGQDLLHGHHEDDPREISTPPRFKTSACAGNILQGAHYYSRNSVSDSSRFSPFFKSKAAAQAHAQLEDDQWGSDDAAAAEDHENFLLVPDCGSLDSGIDVCCDVDGTISLVEDASVHVKIKEEKNGQQQEEEIKTFSSSSKDQQLQQLDSSSSKADESGASTEFESATEFEGFRSPDFGPRDIMCDEFGLDFDFPVPGSSESEVYCDEAHGVPAMGATIRTVGAATAAAPQLSHETASPFAKFLPRLPRKLQEGRGERRERVKKEAEEILRCSLEELSKEELQQVPCLRLDFQEVLNAWSDGDAFWIMDSGQKNSCSRQVPNWVDSNATVRNLGSSPTRLVVLVLVLDFLLLWGLGFHACDLLFL